MTSTSQALPWWASASVAELAASAAVVKDFIREGEVPSVDETTRFARALALQSLCGRATALEEAIAIAAAMTEPYRAWTSRTAAESARPDPTGWVKRSPAVRSGFELCVSMLPEPLTVAARDKMKDFADLSKALEDADRDSYFLDGTRRRLTVAKTRTLPGPKSNG
jgi:hypothetical protein